MGRAGSVGAILAAAVCVAGCIAGCELVAGLNDIGFTGAGGAGGSGGSGAACVSPDDCPAAETVCQVAACTDMACGYENSGPIECEDGGTCDGDGRCIGKQDGSDCTTFIDCASGHCVDGSCASGILWARGYGNSGNQHATAVAVQSDGTATVGGDAGGPSGLDLGKGPVGGGALFFVAIDADGATETALRTGSPNVTLQALAVDALDDVALSGTFDDTVTIDVTVLDGSGDVPPEGYIGVVDGVGGGQRWAAQQFGPTPSGDVFHALVATHPLRDDIALGGDFVGSAMSIAGSPELPVNTGREVFVAKVDSNGNALWAEPFGGAIDDDAGALAMDSVGDVYVAGAGFTEGEGFGDCLPVSGPYLAKINGESGECMWAASGGAATVATLAIAVGPDDAVVMVGDFVGTLDFGGGLLAAAEPSAFVATFDSAGNHLWSAQYSSGAAGDYTTPTAVAVDGEGNLAVAGHFSGTLDFGGWPLNTAAGDADAFIAKLSGADGVLLWSTRFGAPSVQQALALAIAPDDSVVVAGSFMGDVVFGDDDLTNAGGEDIFVIKLAP